MSLIQASLVFVVKSAIANPYCLTRTESDIKSFLSFSFDHRTPLHELLVLRLECLLGTYSESTSENRQCSSSLFPSFDTSTFFGKIFSSSILLTFDAFSSFLFQIVNIQQIIIL